MKKSQNRLFYKAIPIVCFLSIALVCQVAAASAPAQNAAHKSVSANQIGFRVSNSGSPNQANPYQGGQQQNAQRIIDQPAVVIQGNGGGASANAPAPARNAQRPSTSPSMAMEPVVEGFGDKVPLTVAIQQILPQGYGYTLGDGVDAGQLVSWRGGRSWNAVMQDMLASSGLSYSVNGRSVAINSVGATPTIVVGSVPQSVQPVVQPVIQPVQQPVVQVQQPVIMQQPVVQQPVVQQPVVVQQQPQMVMMQQPVVQQPVMVQQPMQQVVVQQPMVVDQQQVMMQQPVVMQPPAVQATSASPQPLQIENPLLFQSQTWEARPGQTLRTLLQEWCTRVGAELNWTAEFDYPIMASMNMTGTFEEAVRVLLTGFDAAKPTPRGRLHYNPAAGQSILIVEADGNHYGD